MERAAGIGRAAGMGRAVGMGVVEGDGCMANVSVSGEHTHTPTHLMSA